MLIKRKSKMSGIEHVMDLNVTEEQIASFELGEGLIQNIFPKLTPSEREFLITGITDDEWYSLFGSK